MDFKADFLRQKRQFVLPKVNSPAVASSRVTVDIEPFGVRKRSLTKRVPPSANAFRRVPKEANKK